MAKKNTSKVAGYIPSLKAKYTNEIVAQLVTDFGYKSAMEAPELEKIVLNQGLGDAVADKKLIDVAVAELSAITGQKAIVTNAKKDISNFKLRKGMPIGAKVTLRGNTMYEFLDKLISIALPRIRDFKGVTNKLDGRGNYSLGVKEQIIFPEIDIEKVTKIMGLEINFVTTAKTDKEALALLKAFGIPFKNE